MCKLTIPTTSSHDKEDQRNVENEKVYTAPEAAVVIRVAEKTSMKPCSSEKFLVVSTKHDLHSFQTKT